ncbi:hypothetical protein ACFU99_40685 [Streptomyces sp. NPDC057654]|uniref:hypothetical protein n=1 Tax=Streptomyces sp. NPDC057654 TaxID=3346196 RepID=UPI0036B88190
MLVAHRLEGVGGVGLVGVGDGVGCEPDDAAGYARCGGGGGVPCQGLTALGLTDPEDPVEKLTGCGRLGLPGAAGDLLVSLARGEFDCRG